MQAEKSARKPGFACITLLSNERVDWYSGMVTRQSIEVENAKSSKVTSMPVQFATSKSSRESWADYVDRLVEHSYISEEDHQKWITGKNRKWTRKVPVTRFDVALRVRWLQKGNTHEEHVFGVEIPISHRVKCTLRLPRIGTLPDDVEFEGFLGENGEPVMTMSANLPKAEFRRRERDLKARTVAGLVKQSKNRPPSEFVERLARENMITASQRKRWQSGRLDSISVSEKQTIMIPCVQIRGSREVTIEVPSQRTKITEVALPPPEKLASPRKKK